MLVWRPIFANKSTTDCTHVGWTELNLDAVPVKSGGWGTECCTVALEAVETSAENASGGGLFHSFMADGKE